MIKLMIYFLSLLVFGKCETVPPGDNIKAITYNIRLDAKSDGPDNWHHRKKSMISFILNEAPDFIGVQEALHHQVEYLDSQLTDYSFIGVGRDDGVNAGEYMAIFYRSERWKITEDSTFWLSPHPTMPGIGWDAACNRVCTFGLFENKNGEHIYISNTHLDHMGKEARKNSLSLLKEHIKELDKSYPSILMGDFNFSPDDPLYASITESVSDCRYLARDIIEINKGTFNGFNYEGSHDRRIDYIFSPGSYLTFLKYRCENPLTYENRFVSDHFPVILEFQIK